jgi:hypothetical protein
MFILKDLPWLIAVILASLALLSGLGYLFLLHSINGRPPSNRWTAGRLFIISLAGLILIAFIVLLAVSLPHF